MNNRKKNAQAIHNWLETARPTVVRSGNDQLLDTLDYCMSVMARRMNGISRWRSIVMTPSWAWRYLRMVVKARMVWNISMDMSVRDRTERHEDFQRRIMRSPMRYEYERLEQEFLMILEAWK